ncbi:ankyrin repeat-containing domain protein [Tribonema minus]|uniref:Ankyrin repeat-containing domain protein n=1 Tax=Tribonema minus TaxID=303371 RepID=A0A835YWZ5_9STRA|nr:ankyrin repeat-containing domain protein [Tribonema minus]
MTSIQSTQLGEDLLQAILDRNKPQIRELLRKGASVNAITFAGLPIMFCAIMLRREDSIRALLRLGANPNTQAGNCTAVIAAASFKLPATVLALVEHGADVRNGAAVPYAVRSGVINSVLILICAGVDVANGVGDLITLAMHDNCGRRAVAMIRVLAAAGVDIDKVNAEGQTPLSRAVRLTTAERATCVTAALLGLGAQPNRALTATRCTAIMLARYPAVVSILVANGADVNAQDATGLTCLHYAAMAGSCDVLQEMINAGADPGINEPWTVAERYGHAGAAKYLREVAEANQRVTVSRMTNLLLALEM